MGFLRGRLRPLGGVPILATSSVRGAGVGVTHLVGHWPGVEGQGFAEQGGACFFVIACDLRRGRRGSVSRWHLTSVSAPLTNYLLRRITLNQFSKSFHHPCRKITFLTQLLKTSHRTLRPHVAKRMQKTLLFVGRRVFTKRLCGHGAVLRNPWSSTFIRRVCDCCSNGCVGHATNFEPMRRFVGRASPAGIATAVMRALFLPCALDQESPASSGDPAMSDSVVALCFAIPGGRASPAGLAAAVTLALGVHFALGRNGPAPPRARSVYWKKWAAKHGYEELKEGAWLEPGLAPLRRT